MIDVALLKKKRKRKIALLVGGITSLSLSVFVIVAFLGQFVGSFTVSISNRGKVEVSLYDNAKLENPTTFLRIGDIPQMAQYSATSMLDDAKMDSDTTDYTYGAKFDKSGNPKFLYFLKYTFFIKNTGEEVIDYTFLLKVTENIKPKNVNYDLLDLSRVRIFFNDYDSTAHDYKTYSKLSENKRIDEEGNPTYKKPVAGEIGTKDFRGYADSFLNDDQLVKQEVEEFMPGQVKRYTIVYWLAGEDEFCKDELPANCSLKLGVEISGYESVESK